MKNIFQITSTIFIIFFILTNSVSAGYWYSGNSKNLYKQIDEGIDELELKMFEYEISGGGGEVKSEINRVLKQENLPECIEKEISPQEFKKISSGDIKLLSEKMGEKCFPNSSNS
ncbi:hypothetical protein CSA08_01965, partial [Candidatus Gracilibacteria bacterium]